MVTRSVSIGDTTSYPVESDSDKQSSDALVESPQIECCQKISQLVMPLAASAADSPLPLFHPGYHLRQITSYVAPFNPKKILANLQGDGCQTARRLEAERIDQMAAASRTRSIEEQLQACVLEQLKEEDISDCQAEVLKDFEVLQQQAPVRPLLRERLEEYRKNLKKRSVAHRADMMFIIALQQILCTKQELVGFVSRERNLSLLHELSGLADHMCMNRIEEIFKDSKMTRALEIEAVKYRDALFSYLKQLGFEYVTASSETKIEKFQQFVRDLVMILGCYPSALIDLGSILAIDEYVDRILVQIKLLASPFERLQACFKERKWTRAS